MIETHTCIVILCDTCGDGYYQDSAPHHFATLEAARAYLADPSDEPEERWRIDDGTPVLCPSHHAESFCDEPGHDWGDWYDHPDNDMVKGHQCNRCGKFESNMALLIEQMTGEA